MLFNNDNKIKDYSDYNRGNNALKPVAIILGVLMTASMMVKDGGLYDIKNFIKDTFGGHDGNDDIAIFMPENKNEMFCPVPGKEIEPLKNYFDDPFKDVMKHYQNDYSFFWVPSDEPKSLSIQFAMRAKQTSDKEQWFASIPDYVIEDPTVQFILSGHASYDLDDKYGFGNGVTRMPDNFEAIEERHAEVNKRFVDARLESVKTRLIDMGISEDRIILRNYGHRFDKRAVDIEVCLPDQIPPEPEI